MTEPMNPTWPVVLSALIAGEDLPVRWSQWAMAEIMDGNASDVQVAGFLVALRSKGETVEEFTGLVEAMVAAAQPLSVTGQTLDIVGTGGDRQNTVNISTMAAIVAAGAGARVVKHGNRAASSSSGSADVIGALGVKLDLNPSLLPAVLDAAGMTFCFAQIFHPSMRFAAPARSQLSVPTAFNFMGPLTNPADPSASAIGCADERMAPIMAGVLAARGKRALVFRGGDGLDELTTTTSNHVWEVREGSITESDFDAESVGLARATLDDLRGGDAAHNAQVVRDLLGGAHGPVRDAVLLNAAGALVAYDVSAEGSLRDRIAAALVRAERAVDSGAAAAVLERWVRSTNS
ncbi:anthranilate phosphoribosyltransferase [Galactobacter caseinivorans]|uniref:Anthranilate phosphoribosyltransferase n=1 Tax=Galactobacter caseinivorans TaxID=2676123 RepID=A0A496PL40_9MICC|nr:anthranilate phosphoribosyltransferase [Galactobacter caseinivorans]RKW71137.1 anthranilate phosphoribosyltransferase [Galactobacter caseinivorans]